MSSPIPEHENSRFWLFRDKFVIVEAVLILSYKPQPSLESFFLHKGLKNQRAIGYFKIVFFEPPYWTYIRKKAVNLADYKLDLAYKNVLPISKEEFLAFIT